MTEPPPEQPPEPELSPAGRPIRDCDICGITDDDPRHVVGLDAGGTQMRHLDCCRTTGCPDGTCDQLTAGVEDLRGDALVQHLTSMPNIEES